MRNSQKISEILSGNELLKIESLHEQVSRKVRTVRLTYVTILCLVGIALAIWMFWSEPKAGIIFLVFLTSAYVIVVTFVCVYQGSKGKPMIFTEYGITIPNLTASFWEEIESYELEEYYGENKVPGPSVLSLAEGTCVRVNLKKEMFSRWMNRFGKNILFLSRTIING